MMIDKIAFLLHDPGMLNHYHSIWRAMDSSSFNIVTTKNFYVDASGKKMPGVDDFTEIVNSEKYDVKTMEELINRGIVYKYVVTNHVIAGNTTHKVRESHGIKFKKYINRVASTVKINPIWKFDVDINTFMPLQIGGKQIRFMYGADISDGWSLQAWNDAYDIFLCHGINDEKALKSRFKGDTFVMGYPRYDRFYDENINLINIKNELKIDEAKLTLLWMPTLGGEYSSIPIFAEPLSTLVIKYNVIVRPHPISFVQEPEFIQLLEKYNFTIDRNVLRDMNELFSVADVVLPDYGGTPFSAIFLGKNIIFLDVPGGDAADINNGSSVLEIKWQFPVITHEEVEKIDELVASKSFYIENNKCVNDLFVKYFNSPRGGGAMRVANYFKSLL